MIQYLHDVYSTPVLLTALAGSALILVLVFYVLPLLWDWWRGG